jgi:hypothetical protein
MTLKFLVAAALFVAVPIVAFAQSKPTIEDAQKLVETIGGDKDKLKAYCEIGKLVVREVLIFRPIEGRPLLSEPRGI